LPRNRPEPISRVQAATFSVAFDEVVVKHLLFSLA